MIPDLAGFLINLHLQVSMDRWEFKECNKISNLIAFRKNNCGKYGLKSK
jgi:hypothetical protein